MTLNVELLERVYEHVAEHADAWDQTTWRDDFRHCGTTFCFAGWTVELTRADTGARWVGTASVECDGFISAPDGYARDVLGLTYDEGNALFLDCPTDLAQLRATLDAIETGRGPAT